MIKVYNAKLLDLLNGEWYRNLHFNISLNGRRMFLRDGKINPHFDLNEFQNNENYFLYYILNSNEDDIIDCTSVGFDEVDFSEKLELYKSFLTENTYAFALSGVPVYKENLGNEFTKIFSSDYFVYRLCRLDKINSVLEQYVETVIYSSLSEINLSGYDCRTGELSFINNVMEKSYSLLQKAPYFANYNYIVYSRNERKNKEEICCMFDF